MLIWVKVIELRLHLLLTFVLDVLSIKIKYHIQSLTFDFKGYIGLDIGKNFTQRQYFTFFKYFRVGISLKHSD